MSKPDWCPQDVWGVAVRMQDELYNWTDEGDAPQQDAETFARAILAERERCAAVAKRWASDDMQSPEVRLVSAYIDREIRGFKP